MLSCVKTKMTCVLHERGQPDGGAHVVGEDEEGAAVGDHAAVQSHAVDDGAHGVLPHAEVHVAPAPLVEAQVAVAFEVGVGRRGEVGRAADEGGQALAAAFSTLPEATRVAISPS